VIDMTTTGRLTKLKLLPYREYSGVDRNDPLRFYFWPIIGRIFRRRIELCLAECTGGQRVLEVGFGSGVTFLNLADKYKEIYGLDLNAEVCDVAEVFRARQIETHLQMGSVLSMPYPDNFFDTVLLISILEHLKSFEQRQAFKEINRVLKPGGQVIYGVPIERRFMVAMFWLLGFNIRKHHFSTQKDVLIAANSVLEKVKVIQMRGIPSFFGPVYEVGHFVKGRIQKIEYRRP
jgi:SAM-dependent methyltransferase